MSFDLEMPAHLIELTLSLIYRQPGRVEFSNAGRCLDSQACYTACFPHATGIARRVYVRIFRCGRSLTPRFDPS